MRLPRNQRAASHSQDTGKRIIEGLNLATLTLSGCTVSVSVCIHVSAYRPSIMDDDNCGWLYQIVLFVNTPEANYTERCLEAFLELHFTSHAGDSS